MEMSKLSLKHGGPATVTLRVGGKDVAQGDAFLQTAPFLFTATGTFNVGVDLGSPVSLDYFDRAPFAFTGKIRDVHTCNTNRKRPH